ncbi:trigger factor [Streptomyces sp. NP160]|uniref:trigger factor n=1 Tax=Streptomyces sp. NP160 TaxID=2586637 RepID=UPI00111A773D|nr:trigger factor [Streptomyces sp. NP160]TNM67678.1 trigger factor [Streptomyces sp. NP160]
MKSDVETLNPTRVKLTVEVSFAELKPSLDKAYKSIAGQVSVPGFRRGKVPARVIDQRFGRGVVIQEAVNEALPGFYQQAVQESSVRPLGQPEVEITEVPVGEGADAGELKFTAEVDVRPTIDLPDFSTIAVSVDDVEVTDADVDAKLEELRVRFGTLVPVERAVQTDDTVSLDLKAEVDGEEVDTAEGITYVVGRGTMLEGMDDALEGAAIDEERSFTTTLAGGERAGETAEVTVVVKSVKVRELPELDDDFAQLASEFDTVDELRADLRTKAQDEAEFRQGVQARDKVLEALLEQVEIPVPDGVVEDEVHRHLENESRLEDDEHRAEVTEETRRVLRTQFLLDAVAEAEQVTVAQQELVEYIVAQAPAYGMDPNSFAQAMDQAGQVPALVQEVARRKALAAVLEKATVTDASGNKVDLGDEDDDAEGAEPATDETAEDAAEARAAEEKPKRTRAKKPAADAEAAEGSEDAAEAPAAEEKPKRTRAKKPAADAEAAEGSEDAAEAPAAEEKPKRTRKPKTEAAEAAGTAEAAEGAEGSGTQS